MGVNLAARHAPEGLARLSDVLDALAGYRGVIIVDCKDERPGRRIGRWPSSWPIAA